MIIKISKLIFRSDDRRGLTILEVLVAIGIFTLIIGGITATLSWGLHGRDVVMEQLFTQNEGRKIIQDFINEIRRAGQSAIGGFALESAEPQSVVFYSNLDADIYRERVRYFLSGMTLKASGNPLSYASSTEVITDIVHNIANNTSSLFNYYSENFTGADDTPLVAPIDPTVVRVVGIRLMLEEKPNVSPAPFYIETKAMIRNLKTN